MQLSRCCSCIFVDPHTTHSTRMEEHISAIEDKVSCMRVPSDNLHVVVVDGLLAAGLVAPIAARAGRHRGLAAREAAS